MPASEKTLHTPGPWKLETVTTQVGLCHKIGDFPGSCGHTPGYACVYEDGLSRRAVFPRLEETELLANARLMRAAPELLDSCKETRDACAALFRFVGERGLGIEAMEAILTAGVKDGFGARADTAIATATGGA